MCEEHSIEYWDRKYKLWHILHGGIWNPENKCVKCVSCMYKKGIIGDLELQRVIRRNSYVLQAELTNCPIRDVPRLILNYEFRMKLSKIDYYLETRILVGVEDCKEWIKYE
jgi:hypothetical protein